MADRKMPSNEYKYKSNQIITTLESLLLQPHSPTQNLPEPSKDNRYHTPYTTPCSSPSDHPQDTRYRPPHARSYVPSKPGQGKFTAGINALDAIDETTPPSPDDQMTTLCSQLDAIDVPANDEDAAQLYGHYVAEVCRISSRPNHPDPPNCIVCGDRHRFENCDLLKNTSFLREHYIRVCQLRRRDENLRANLNTPSSGPMQSANHSQQTASDQDFRSGRH